jgi:hypothetical protein
MTASRANADPIIALALAGGGTVEDAAKAANVCTRTVNRRMKDADFKAEVSRLRGEMISRATGRLAEGMGWAALVLRTLLTSSAEGIRLRAAAKILDSGLRVVELHELAERVAALEQNKR